MTLFWIVAAVFVVAALLFVLPPLAWRRAAPMSPDAAGANLSVYRDQVVELDTDLAAGNISAEQHRAAYAELQRRVIEDTGGGDPAPAAGRSLKSAALIGLGLPIFAVALYLYLGSPEALAPQGSKLAEKGAGHSVTVEQVAAMVERLAQRLKTQPDDFEGWVMLSRSYAALGRFDDAKGAYAHAVTLAPNDAQLLADYADAFGMAQGRSLEGEPWRLIQMALAIDPDNIKALALAGSAAFERKDFGGAAGYWRKAAQLASPESEFARGLAASLDEARGLAQKSPQPPTAAKATTRAADAGQKASIAGRVVLSPALAAKIAPNDIVFVFARAAEGPRMPLAILKRSARELPMAFALDDSLAMSPEMKLSKFASVVVGARVSKSGEATPRPGDLQGQAGPLKVGSQGVEIVIDKIVP